MRSLVIQSSWSSSLLHGEWVGGVALRVCICVCECVYTLRYSCSKGFTLIQVWSLQAFGSGVRVCSD